MEGTRMKASYATIVHKYKFNINIMKFKNLLLLMAGLGVLAGACSKKPADVVNDVYNNANNKNFSKILQYIVPDSVSPFTDAEQKMFEEFLSATYSPDFEGANNDGPVYSSFTVDCAEPSEDATEMKFTVNTQLANGMSYSEKGTLIKGSDGKWRLALANAPNDTTTYFSVSDPDNKTPELMRNLQYAYVMTMATRGLPEYQVMAADYYYNGVMTYKDLNKYFELVKNAADKGYPIGLYRVGQAYYKGDRGVNQDLEKAHEYYLKAAEAGDTDAMFSLGYDYHYGAGTIKDYQKALEWYQKAADEGNVKALNNIAVMYANGEGVERDEVKAFDLYLKAAEGGSGYAMNNVAKNYSNGQGTEKNMEKAIEWATKSAEAGNINGMINLADYYYEGTGGIDKNYDKAFYWYKKAADEGNVYSMYMTGQCYEYGRGTEKNKTAAMDIYKKAWNKDYKPASEALLRLRHE